MGGAISPTALPQEHYNFDVTVGTTSAAVTSRDLNKWQPVGVAFKAHPDNAGRIFVGNKILGIATGATKRKISTTTGWPLEASQDIAFETSDPRLFSAIASQADQILCVHVSLANFPDQTETTS